MMMFDSAIRRLLLFAIFVIAAGATAQTGNLARSSTASASETYQDLTPQKAIDGNLETRWSGIPGHNSDVWFQLTWKRPVTVSEVLVRQYQPFTYEWDVQVADDTGSNWITVQHFGQPGVKLPTLVLCTLPKPVTTTAIRIANITNGPSFSEVEVYSAPHRDAIQLASDLRGNFVGMVCDGFGIAPVQNQPVLVTGTGLGGPWSRQPTTDTHGMFFCPMPVGMQGIVQASSGASVVTYQAADFQRAITPIDTSEPITQIDSGWKFHADPPQGFEQRSFDDLDWPTIRIPRHWEMEGFHPEDGVGGYRVRFTEPEGHGRLMLRFDGVYSGAMVWLNGRLVATHMGGFTPFEADITGDVVPGPNLLAVKVVEHTLVSDSLDKMSQYADFPLAGIIRKVTLYRVPTVHVEAIEQSCHFDSGGRLATVKGTLAVVNGGGAPFQAVPIRVTILGGSSFAAQVPDMPGYSRAIVPFEVTLSDPVGWSAETPQLYTLRVVLGAGTAPEQVLRQSIGLRETTIQGTAILINGTPAKFRGTCHHDSDPVLGRAVTPAVELKDVEMIKQANLNALRTSHYPPLPELIEDADRLGLYVEDEADFCWVDASDDLRNTPRIIQLTAELLARDRNHPSVFMWSLCNESGFGYGFERSHEWVRSVDPSRPTSAATSASLEIATMHNPISIARINSAETKIDKPLLFDEAWCIYQGIFNDVAEMWVDPGMRDYYAQPLPQIFDAFMKSRVTRGSMIWAWSDDLFCVPGRGLEYGRQATRSHFVDEEYVMPHRGLVGDAPWGVVDGWRRPKPEFWITKKLQSPIKVSADQPVSGKHWSVTLENQYDFTNLKDVEVRIDAGSYHSSANPDVPPHSSRSFEVPVGGDVQPLRLAFYDKSGSLIDSYSFGHAASASIAETPSAPLQVRDVSMLAGNSVDIAGQSFKISIDKDTGLLRACVAYGDPLLLELPSIHVLPTDAPTRPIPDPLDWVPDGMVVDRVDEDVVVRLKGHYPDFKGDYAVTVSPDGRIRVDSDFLYSGPEIRAREIGLRFSLPRSCERLTWSRDAEWSVYPNDHIGRPDGAALAFDSHSNAVPPEWPWSEDNTPMGTNDFRSTKRNIHYAVIGYPNGPSIAVTGNGVKSFRACVDTDRISAYVNDWFGGTNVGWGEWISNYGTGKVIKTGDVLRSTLSIKIAPPRRP